jgi:hypothetical protein
MTIKELLAKFFRKLWSRRKVIAIVLIVVGCAHLISFPLYSVIAYFFALSIHNPEMIRKVIPKGLQKSVYETKWKAENYFSDPKTIELCRAIEKQDVEEMQRIIDSGADVNAKGKDNMRLLLWSYHGGEEVMECLLKNGADPNFILESNYGMPEYIILPGTSFLCMAAVTTTIHDPKFYNYVDLLLKYGADPDLGRPTPLSALITFHSSEIGRKALFSLLDAGADVNLASNKNIYSNLPINKCLVTERTDLIFPLLEHGVIYDVNTPQGAALQRRLYRFTVSHPEVLNTFTEHDRENIKKAVAWLEERGVSFDEPAPEPESLEKP